MSEQASSTKVSNTSRSDPGWKYCTAMEGGTNRVRCNFCDNIMMAGITRGKEHLMGKSGKVAPCKKCPPDVKEELWKLFRERTDGGSAEMKRGADIDFGGLGFSDKDEEEVQAAGGSTNSSRSAMKSKGPMDLFCRKPEATDKKRQLNIRGAVDKKATSRVHQYIARFWYQTCLSFNLVKLKSFQDMLEAIGAYGRHLKAPSYHAIRVPLLKKELELTEQMLKTNIEEWTTYGCSIMSDGWTDRTQRTIINILVNLPFGTVFLKSIDGSDFVKTGQKLFELLDSMMEKVGVKNVVQVVTDNGSNYVAVGKLLMDKHPNLYWTPCAAHCIVLMLEDIGKLPEIKKTIRKGVSLVGFIYNHASTLSLLRKFTNKRELVRPTTTRFATSFLSLERIHQEKGNIRKMFTSEEWVGNKLFKEAKGREATKTALMPSFWRSVVLTPKVMAPLVRVLQLVDGDKKPTMGYIYETMDKAKETIEKSFNKVESKYKDVFSIIDDRWNCQLHRPLHAAAHFLNPDIYYDNMRHIEFDIEVIKGLYDCIERLMIGKEVVDKILAEVNIYKLKQGIFGRDLAERQRKKIAPDKKL